MIYYISRDVPYEKTSIQRLKCQRVFIVFLLSVDIGADVMSNGVFRCTWSCDVCADVACGGVVRCVVVIKLCVGVDGLDGILGVY